MLTAGGWGVDKFQKKNLQKSSSILHVCWNPNIIFRSTFTPPKQHKKWPVHCCRIPLTRCHLHNLLNLQHLFWVLDLKVYQFPGFVFDSRTWQQLLFGLVRIQKEKFERWCFPDGSMWGILCFFWVVFCWFKPEFRQHKKRSHVEKHGQYSKRLCFCPFSGGVLCELCQMFDW